MPDSRIPEAVQMARVTSPGSQPADPDDAAAIAAAAKEAAAAEAAATSDDE